MPICLLPVFLKLPSAHPHGNVENIKYSVIRLLRAYLDNWLAIVVRHAILATEQERRAKEHTEVWKTSLDKVFTHSQLLHSLH